MSSYVYDRNRDGVFYMDLSKTWEKTMVAARIIAAIQENNPKDVLVSALNTVSLPAQQTTEHCLAPIQQAVLWSRLSQFEC